MPQGGVPIVMPTDTPTASAVRFTNWEEDLLSAVSKKHDAMTPGDLGRMRVEVLRGITSLPTSDDQPSDKVIADLLSLAAETSRTVLRLSRDKPRPAVLWNEELNVASFLGRTLLLADHVLYPDKVFTLLLHRGTVRDLRAAAQRQLEHFELLRIGIAIPVPQGVAMAAQGQMVLDMTERDLQNQELVDWVGRQLILEGPTAREALLVRVVDDLATAPPKIWFYGRIDPDSLDAESGHFGSRMLRPYDPQYDYSPWVNQVRNSATSAFVQRTNERIIAADMFGSEYVSASLFEARLLRNRGRDSGLRPAQAAVWADVPHLPSLTSPDLVKILKNESAVEDLRRQVRASLATARTDSDNVDALTGLAYELEAASHKLMRTARSDLAWQGALPVGFGTASMVIGGVAGGLAGVAGVAAGAASVLAPLIGNRLNARRDAAYVFVRARRSARTR